jgi:autotransporter-associated beta strand protein
MNLPIITKAARIVQLLQGTFPAIALLVLLSAASSTLAGSATWNDTGPDWNTTNDWMPTSVPNDPADTATFDLASTFTSVDISANTQVAGISFSSLAANAFTISVAPNMSLTIQDTGVTNNSGIIQNFVAANESGQASFIFFEGTNATAGIMTQFTSVGGSTNGSPNSGIFFDGASATAGSASFINSGGTASGALGGLTDFSGASSTAGSGTFINNPGTFGGIGGFVEFDSTATAGSAIFTNNGGETSGAYGLTIFTTGANAGTGTFTNNGGTATGADGGQADFFDNSTAADGTFTNNAGTVDGAIGGSTQFSSTSTAGSATLIANGGLGEGGSIRLLQDSTGGTARVEIFNNGTGTAGNLDISGHYPPGMTIGSIEGSGNVFLGSENLSVGSNNLSTTFSGVIQDGGASGGTNGALTKVGTGILTLSGTNTYTGATTVSEGQLIITGSLGDGPVTVASGGVLSGTGTINGLLTIDDGGIVDLTGGTFTDNNAITNNGLFILSNASQLAGITSFTNNGTLDIITDGLFTQPAGFVNNGLILDSSVVKVKTAQKSGTTFIITIDSYTGHTYQLQSSTSLDPNSFANVSGVAAQQGSTGNVLTFTDPNATDARGFYRILVSP